MIAALTILVAASEISPALAIPTPESAPPPLSEIVDQPSAVKFPAVGPDGKLIQTYFRGCVEGAISQRLSRRPSDFEEVIESCFNILRGEIGNGKLPGTSIRPFSYDLEWIVTEPSVDFIVRYQEPSEKKNAPNQ